MISPLEVRSHFLTLLNGLIGTYLFSDGRIEQAIAILPDEDHGWDFPNNGTVPTGIECVIIRPYPSIKELIGGRQKKYEWAVTLKQWDASNNLLAATEKLVNNLPYLLTSPRTVPPNPALGNIETVRFEFVEYEYQAISA